MFRISISGKLYFEIVALCFSLLFMISSVGFTQDGGVAEKIRVEKLESQVKNFYGVEKFDALLDLCSYYTKINGRKSTRYGKQAVMLAEEIFLGDDGQALPDSTNRFPRSYIQLGKAYYFYNKFIDAKETFDQASERSKNNDFIAGISQSALFLDRIDSLALSGQEVKRGFLSQSIKSLELKEKVAKTTLDWSINTKISSAEAHQNKYEFEDAITDYEAAINLLKNKGDENRILVINDKIAEIRKLMNINQELVNNYNDAIAEQERIIAELSTNSIGKDTDVLISRSQDSTNIQLEIDIENLELQSDSLDALAIEFMEKKDFGRAEEYRALHQQVEGEIEKRENAETQLTLLRQQKQIAEFNLQNKNMELASQRKTKQNFMFGGGMLLALAVALFALYISKQRDHKKLGRAYDVLEKTQSKLSIAEGNIRKLLRQQLSEDIAIELMAEGTSLKTKKSFVCVMFLDIRGFTPWAEKHDPEEIINYQNKVFGFMMDIVNDHKGNVNQLLGDGFMATFGAPKSSGNDCQNAFDAALKIIKKLNQKIENQEIDATRIGIGLHAGFVVTGNVGTDFRRQYSITGNTVILASRIEQLNKEFGSQLIISREVHNKLDHFQTKNGFQEVIVKGRRSPIEVLTVA